MGKRVYLVAMVAVGLIISTVVFGVALALLTPSQGGPPGLPSASEATEEYRSLSGLAATRVTTVEYANGTERTTRARVRLRPAGDTVSVRWEAPAEVAGTVVARNGSGTLTYDPDRGTATRTGRTRTAAARVAYANFLDSVFTDDTSGTGEVAPTGVSPVPVLPGTDGEAAGRLTFDSVHSVSYRGNETVDGHDTIVLDLRRGEGNHTVTVWLERRHFVPVKARSVTGSGADRRITTVRHTNLRFEPRYDDGFAFEPPAGTAVAAREETATVETFDDISVANASTPFTVPDPAPPGDLRFGRAQFVRDDTRPVLTMQYRPQTVTNESAILIVSKAPVEPGTTLGREGLNDSLITVAGQRAVFSPDAGGRYDLRTVRWRCDGYAYSVTGSANRTTAVTMAERVGCE
jgi:outer membrane lipoprotein-sorting protein